MLCDDQEILNMSRMTPESHPQHYITAQIGKSLPTKVFSWFGKFGDERRLYASGHRRLTIKYGGRGELGEKAVVGRLAQCMAQHAYNSAKKMKDERNARLRDNGKSPIVDITKLNNNLKSDFYLSLRQFISDEIQERLSLPYELMKSRDGISPMGPRQINELNLQRDLVSLQQKEAEALARLSQVATKEEVNRVSAELTATDPIKRGTVQDLVLPKITLPSDKALTVTAPISIGDSRFTDERVVKGVVVRKDGGSGRKTRKFTGRKSSAVRKSTDSPLKTNLEVKVMPEPEVTIDVKPSVSPASFVGVVTPTITNTNNVPSDLLLKPVGREPVIKLPDNPPQIVGFPASQIETHQKSLYDMISSSSNPEASMSNNAMMSLNPNDVVPETLPEKSLKINPLIMAGAVVGVLLLLRK